MRMAACTRRTPLSLAHSLIALREDSLAHTFRLTTTTLPQVETEKARLSKVVERVTKCNVSSCFVAPPCVSRSADSLSSSSLSFFFKQDRITAMSGNKTAAFIIHSAASYPAASKDASSSDFRRLGYPSIEKGASSKHVPAPAPVSEGGGDAAAAKSTEPTVKSAIIFPYKGTQIDERRGGSGGEELAVAEPYQDYEVLLSVQVRTAPACSACGLLHCALGPLSSLLSLYSLLHLASVAPSHFRPSLKLFYAHLVLLYHDHHRIRAPFPAQAWAQHSTRMMVLALAASLPT